VNIQDIQVGKYYAVRLGQWVETARVDAIHDGKPIVYVVGHWRPLPVSAFIRESRSPEQSAAIAREQASKHRKSVQDELASQEASRKVAPADCRPRATQTIIHRQGTHFEAGDYGINRE